MNGRPAPGRPTSPTGRREKITTRRLPRLAAALLAVALVGSGCALAPVDLAGEKPLKLRSTIRATDGSLLARLYRQNREPVKLRDIPPAAIDAVLAAEDKDFFKHPGYDLRAMARALLVNAREGEIVQGGSTITQQYVKNTFFRRPARTYQRKLRELRLSIEVERTYSKSEILERYLNTVYFGHGAYGIEAAAETYFGHRVGTVTLEEASLLAGLIKAPSSYDPHNHPKRARVRRDWVIQRMLVNGDINRRRADAARSAPLGLLPQPPRTFTREPYFVEAVRQELLRDRRLGPDPDTRDRLLYEGGLSVTTTLVPSLQRSAERAVDSILGRPGDPSAALVAIRPRSGRIVAMVGGDDWTESQVNLALGVQGGGSGRQAGSSFKPIAAAAALESGIPLSQEYESGPASFLLNEDETWSVANAEGQDYGELPLDESLVRSINGVYARLALDIGGGVISSQARLMGVRSRLTSYPSIALGTVEVSVLDMAAAYATLANGGTAVEPTTIEEIRTSDGHVYVPDQEIVQGAMSPGNAYLLTRVLEDVIERGTGTGADIGRPAAGKTGTTDDYADAWFVGYTPQLVTAVWVGYPEGRIPMTSVHGITVMGGTFPASIWRTFMTAAHKGTPVRSFDLPREELVSVEIDPETGLLAAPWCKSEEKVMLRQLVPTEVCPMPPAPSPAPSVSPTEKPSPSPTEEDPDGPGDADKDEPGSPSGTPSPEPSDKPDDDGDEKPTEKSTKE